ncbi:hypothetical protein [Nocardia farcinica]|uniref:hypothetical protein n=1 Tax=Nocardia farcinica TaxID=37329 RepID=UPI0024579818|nr:hypothetical protein [Nocardia farcinica]
MTTLRDLLQLAADRGLSTRAMESEVEKAAEASGREMNLSRATASRILSGQYKSKPSDSTIRAVAYLAGVPERIAFDAAGMPPPALPFADELPEGVDQLSPKRRRVAIEVLRSLVEAEQIEHGFITMAAHPSEFLDAYCHLPDEVRDRMLRRVSEASEPTVNYVLRRREVVETPEQPKFDRSQLLAAMSEPEGDREPDDEFPVDPPNDDFEGR